MITIGTAGWSIPRAVAQRFPGEGTHLERYARVLSGAEINTSFFRSHAFATYQKWAALTPRGFRFAVKLPQAITHAGRLRRARVPLEKFLGEVAGLGFKLGPLLVQLPPSLAFETRPVRNFFTLLRDRHGGAVVCEPRHQSWFTPRADALLAAHQIGRVAADPALCPAAAQPGGWLGPAGDGAGAAVYFRLHGSPRRYWSAYTPEQLREWAGAMRSVARGADTWCIFDNTAAGAAIENALRLIG